MIVMNCPHCGMQAQIPPGVSPYLCGFCRRSFDVGGSPVVVFHHQPVRYSSGLSLYWMIRLGAVALFGLVSLGGWIYHRATGKQIAGITDLDDDNDVWTGSAPLTCGGADDLSFTGVTATFTSGPAITAGGNCKVTCKGCTLRAPQGIQAGGNAAIVLIGGSLEAETAIAAGGNAKVDVQGGAKVTGTVDKSGNATVTGIAPPASASVAAHAPAPSAAPHPATPAKPPAKKK